MTSMQEYVGIAKAVAADVFKNPPEVFADEYHHKGGISPAVSVGGDQWIIQMGAVWRVGNFFGIEAAPYPTFSGALSKALQDVAWDVIGIALERHDASKP